MPRRHIFSLSVFSVLLTVNTFNVPIYKSEIGYFTNDEPFKTSIFLDSLKGSTKTKRNSPVKIVTSEGEVRYLNHNYDAPKTVESLQIEDKKADNEYTSEKSDAGYNKKHHKDIEEQGKHKKHHQKVKHSESGGKQRKYHDDRERYSKYKTGEEQRKFGKFGEQKGHKKGHKTKEYHNTFHRDEYHREHRFYDDAHQSGYHEKQGNHHSYYDKQQGNKKHGAKHSSGYSKDKFGKGGHSERGSSDLEHNQHSKKYGHERYNNKNKEYEREKDRAGGRHYGYAKH